MHPLFVHPLFVHPLFVHCVGAEFDLIYRPFPALVYETVSAHSQGQMGITSGLGFSQDRARPGGGWTTSHSITVLSEGASVDGHL